jgi:putative peptide zinc metalloprotease protein
MASLVAPAPGGREALVPADGVELIGEYEGSGFREPPLLARRGDGQMIQLSRLLYEVAAACDGKRDAEAVAERVSPRYGRRVSAANVQSLADRKLRPLGILALADGTTPVLPKRAPVMALRHRRPLVPERGVNVLARGFQWLHRPLVLAAVLLGLAALDVWVFWIHGVAGGLRAVLYRPVLLLGLLGSIVVATAFHEIGHASACRYSGARPGAMGVGVYLVWPAFYCDVTDAYRLNRAGRLRTDLGGVYFNGIFALLAGAAYFRTGEEALLLVIAVQHSIVLQQLLPLMRFDGYYVLSDLTGVPDILSRIKPIFRSLAPGGGREPQVDALKPWVRAAVTAYLLVLVPALAFMIGSTLLAAPRMLATAYDSLGLQLDRIRAGGDAAEVALGGVQMGALLLPLGAMAVSLSRTGRMAARGLLSWSAGGAGRRAAAALATAAVAGGLGYTWWPNGDYQPIRPGERGTIGDAAGLLPAVPGGRPSLTPHWARQLAPVPTVRARAAASRGAAPRHPKPGGAPGARPAGPGRPLGGGSPGTLGWTDPAPGGARGDAPAPAATATPSPDASPTASATPAQPAAATPGATASPTVTPTATATVTPSATPSPTATATPSPTPSAASSADATPTPMATATP